MSKPKYRWYGYIKSCISHIEETSPSDSLQDAIMFQAFTDSLQETLKLPNGELRAEVINNVLVKKVSTIQGEAMRIHYSPDTVIRWMNSFVNMVGVKAGYSKKKGRR